MAHKMGGGENSYRRKGGKWGRKEALSITMAHQDKRKRLPVSHLQRDSPPTPLNATHSNSNSDAHQPQSKKGEKKGRILRRRGKREKKKRKEGKSRYFIAALLCPCALSVIPPVVRSRCKALQLVGGGKEGGGGWVEKGGEGEKGRGGSSLSASQADVSVFLNSIV